MPPAVKVRWRDAFIYATIALVAVAAGLGLYLHLDVESWLAAAVAVPLAMALLQAHQLQARGRQITALRRDIVEVRRQLPPNARLQREPATVANHAGGGPRAAGSGPMTNSVSAPSHTAAIPATSSHGPGSHGPGQVPHPRPQQVALEAQPQPAQIIGAQAVPGAAARPAPPSAPPQPALLQLASRSQAGVPLAAAASEHQVVRTDATKNSLPPPLPLSARLGLPPAPAGSSKDAMSAGTDVGPARTTQVASSQNANQVSEALMGTYWGHRPGVTSDATAAKPAPAGGPPGSGGPGLGHEAPARAVALAPGLDEGPGERELETMQNLIQQLAQQLNAPRHGRSEAASPASATPGLDLSQSVAALRSTAGTMRHEPDVAAGPPKAEQVISPEPRVAAAPVADSTGAGELAGEPGTSEKHAVPTAGDLCAGSAAGASRPEATAQNVAMTQRLTEAMTEPVAPASKPAAATAATASPYAEIARVAEAIAADRVEVFLDPILALADRKARLFEVSVRLRASDGDVLDPASIRSVASGTGLLARIDAAKLSRSARVAARLQARGTTASLYSNVASESLSDDIFLDTFEDAIAEQEELPKRLVLSFSQADVRAFNTVHWETVAAMSEIGLRFALEDVTDLDMDFERLNDTGFEFIKLDARMFLEGLPAAGGAIPAPDLCRHLASHGFTLIVGRIEDETSHAKLMGFGVLFGQGTFFGSARQVQVDTQPVQQQVAAA